MNRRLVLFLIVLLGFTSCDQETGSKALSKFEEDNARSLRSFYFYPSTLRTFAKLMGGEYANSLAGLKEVRVLISWNKKDENSEEQFKELEAAILEEGSEVMAKMKSSGNRFSIFVNDKGVLPIYIMIIENEDGNYALELKGEISYSSLTKLADMDFSKAQNLIDLGKPRVEEEKSDSISTNQVSE